MLLFKWLNLVNSYEKTLNNYDVVSKQLSKIQKGMLKEVVLS